MFIEFLCLVDLSTHPVAQLQVLVLGQGQVLTSLRARMEIRTMQIARTATCSVLQFQVLVEGNGSYEILIEPPVSLQYSTLVHVSSLYVNTI